MRTRAVGHVADIVRCLGARLPPKVRLEQDWGLEERTEPVETYGAIRASRQGRSANSPFAQSKNPFLSVTSNLKLSKTSLIEFQQYGSTLTYWVDDAMDWEESCTLAAAINPAWILTRHRSAALQSR